MRSSSIPGNFTFAMKLAESAADCALFSHLHHDHVRSPHKLGRPRGYTYCKESVVKFCTGTERPVRLHQQPRASHIPEPDTASFTPSHSSTSEERDAP